MNVLRFLIGNYFVIANVNITIEVNVAVLAADVSLLWFWCCNESCTVSQWIWSSAGKEFGGEYPSQYYSRSTVKLCRNRRIKYNGNEQEVKLLELTALEEDFFYCSQLQGGFVENERNPNNF